MPKLRVLLMSFGLFLVFGISNGAISALAQSNPRFVPLGGAAKGALYVPDSGPPPHVAFLVTHRTSNYMTHTSTAQLSTRGFMVLGMNSRFDNNDAIVNWEDIALDVRSGIRYLRSQPGITTVILIGPSAGGPVVSYYQAVAEKGPAYCQGLNKLTECSSERLAGFVPTDRADGIVYLDPTLGSVSPLQSLNGSVRNEHNPANSINARLDPFSVRNGFNPDGDSVYSEDFVKRYSDAQSRRMNNLIDTALKIKADIEAGKHFPTDDDAFVFHRGSAELADLSTGVLCCTLNPAKLLKNNGTIQDCCIVKTVRVSDPSGRESDASFEGTRFFTLTSFLSANAVRSTNSLDEIDWCSSNSSTVCAVATISVPTLVMSMQGHNLIRDGERIFESSPSADKAFVVVEGATHGGAACTECTAVTGVDYSNARKNIYDYVAAWTNARF
jgi:hypothetical protein